MALDTVISGNKIGRNFREDEIQQLYMNVSGLTGRVSVVQASAGRQIHVVHFEYCTSTALTLSLGSIGSSNVFDVITRQIFVANGGLYRHVDEVRHPLYSTSAGARFVIDQSVAPTAAHLCIHWRYVGLPTT